MVRTANYGEEIREEERERWMGSGRRSIWCDVDIELGLTCESNLGEDWHSHCLWELGGEIRTQTSFKALKILW